MRTRFSADSATRVVRAGGLRVTDPVRAWCELASSLSVDECTIMADALMRRKHPIADPEQLATAVAEWRGRRGHRVLLQALDLARPGTDSVRETELRLAIVRAGLPEPEVNPRILDALGRLLGHGDLTYPRYKVLVEYDGEQHRTDDAQYVIDVERLEAFARDGWICVRILKHHAVDDFAPAIRKVQRALEDRGWPGVA